MSKLGLLFQFFPLGVFLYCSRQYGWPEAFQISALVAALQFSLVFFLKQPMARLLTGVNLYLIFGGFAFVLDLEFIQLALKNLMESMLFASIFIVFLVATIFTKAGAFEKVGRSNKNYSWVIVGLSFGCIFWSYFFRADVIMAGTVPFLILVFVKGFFERKL